MDELFRFFLWSLGTTWSTCSLESIGKNEKGRAFVVRCYQDPFFGSLLVRLVRPPSSVLHLPYPDSPGKGLIRINLSHLGLVPGTPSVQGSRCCHGRVMELDCWPSVQPNLVLSPIWVMYSCVSDVCVMDFSHSPFHLFLRHTNQLHSSSFHVHSFSPSLISLHFRDKWSWSWNSSDTCLGHYSPEKTRSPEMMSFVIVDTGVSSCGYVFLV
jgi:hypothetical protein